MEPSKDLKIINCFLKGITGSLVCVALFIRRKRLIEVDKRKTKADFET